VTSFEPVAPYTLRVGFNDGTQQVIDFQPILAGQIYGPLRDLTLFNRVRLDPEVHTLVWPNDADFDPVTLHDWPKHLAGLKALARKWAKAESEDEWTAVRRVQEAMDAFGPFESLAALSRQENVPLPTLAQAARERRFPALHVATGWLARLSAVRKRLGLNASRGRPAKTRKENKSRPASRRARSTRRPVRK
jgi:hypothetical protein